MIYIKISDFQASAIENIDLPLSMASYCKELYDLFTMYYPQFAFNLDWNNSDSIHFEDEPDMSVQIYEDLKQDLINFQSVIYDRQTWLILKP